MRPIVLLSCGGSPSPTYQAGSAGPTRTADFGPIGRVGVKVEYVRAVEAGGGVPLLLPDCRDAAEIDRAIAAGDALLLTGGGDVAPSRYGEPAHPLTARIDPVRDAVEDQAVRAAMRRGLPMLGICRGIQVFNVVLGGTLIQDIPDHFAGAPVGEGGLVHAGTDHSVAVEGGSMLAGLWPGGQLIVNSRHHQAVGDLAGPLRATARAPDGIIEAVESTDGYPLLGLQCHPEDLWSERTEFLTPFKWLTEAAARRCR